MSSSKSWDEARALAHTVGTLRLLPAQTVPLEQAHNLVLATGARAKVSLPGANISAMDGWVVCGPGPWLLGEPVNIGPTSKLAPLANSQARPIVTGAAVPPGPVSVVRSELGRVVVREHTPGRWLQLEAPEKQVRLGRDIRLAGEELQTGDLILAEGTLLEVPQLGLLAASGFDEVTVRPRVRVAVVSSGPEVVSSGLPKPGQVRDAIFPMLTALLPFLGGEVVGQVQIGDDLQQTKDALAVADADLIISTGGSSHGRADFLRSAIKSRGGSFVFDSIRMRPGHPTFLGQLGEPNPGLPVLGLPGNPFAALCAVLTIAAPLLRAMRSLPLATKTESEPVAFKLSGVGGAPMRVGPDGDTQIVAVRKVASGWEVLPHTGSAMLRGVSGADAIFAVQKNAGDKLVARKLSVPWLAN